MQNVNPGSSQNSTIPPWRQETKSSAAQTVAGDVSAYGRAAPALIEAGYCAIPTMTGEKRPGCNGFGLKEWQKKFLRQLPTPKQIKEWSSDQGAGVGIVLGKASQNVVAIDIDDERVEGTMRQILPASPVEKIGKRGCTIFYRASEELAANGRKYKSKDGMLVEFLATGQQTVIPPTIHPDTGEEYRWSGEGELGLADVAPIDLPLLPDDVLEQIAAALEPSGYHHAPSDQPHSKRALAPPRQPTKPAMAGQFWRERGEAYARAALDDEAAKVSSALPGTRNDTLNDAAIKMGHYAHIISPEEITRVLLNAAEVNGEIADDGIGQPKRTIEGALKKGMSEPKDPPIESRFTHDIRLEPKPEKVWEPLQDRNELLLSAWLERDIPPRDFLLGGVFSTTSRWLIVGETGVGKTLFTLEMAAAISAGQSFLGWDGHRPCRVMYLDGEMPAETFKERLTIVANAYGTNLKLFAYNRDVLGEDEMPPLNTPDGKTWLWREIETVKPDMIVIDSIMCCTSGNMSEEDSWEPIKALVRALSSQRIGQIWLHHTGHDASRAYGTKTREWEMDTVVMLTKQPEDEEFDESGMAPFKLAFSKKRLCSPHNFKEFESRTVARGDNGFTSEKFVPKKGGRTVSDGDRMFQEAVRAYHRLAGDVDRSAGFDGKPVLKIKVEDLREHLRDRGYIDQDDNRKVSSAGRTAFWRAKKEMLSKGFIESDGMIWEASPAAILQPKKPPGCAAATTY